MARVILSLFDYSGEWVRPYEEHGYSVILWDIKHTTDMYSTFSDIKDACTDFFYENIFDNYGTIDGILAAPPCTDFSVSGNRFWKRKDEDGTTQRSLELIYQTLRIIDLCMPDFWALENPVGRLPKLCPELGKPWYFQPFDFGDPYTKKTGLWGKFNKPVQTPVLPLFGSEMASKYGGKSEKTKEFRSITPTGFANAFFKANR